MAGETLAALALGNLAPLLYPRVTTLGRALPDPKQKKTDPNLFFQAKQFYISSTIEQIYKIHRSPPPQIDNFRGAPQGVLHQLKL